MYSQNFLINSKVILHDIFYGTSVNFFMYWPLALHPWHVWSNVRRNIQHLFTLQLFPFTAIQGYELPHATTFNVARCVY